MNAPPLPPLAAEEPPEPAAAPSETPYPPIFGPPRPPHREKAPVRSLDLAELLFLISGLMLLAAGFQNLGAGVAGLPVQYLLLGIVATLFGLVQTALVVMHGMMSDLERSSGTMMVVTALLFLIWAWRRRSAQCRRLRRRGGGPACTSWAHASRHVRKRLFFPLEQEAWPGRPNTATRIAPLLQDLHPSSAP